MSCEFRDNSSLHYYRTEIPNIIWDLGLDCYERDAYSYFKRISGDKGSCYQSNKKIQTALGIGETKLREIKKKLSSHFELIGGPLIKTTQRKNENNEFLPTLIEIIDIWPKNFEIMSSKKSKIQKTSPDEWGTAPEKGGVPREAREVPRQTYNKEDPIKEDPIKEDICAADGDAKKYSSPFSKSKSKEKVVPMEEKVIRRSSEHTDIRTSSKEHQKLLSEFGEDLTSKAYDELLAWKDSKAQVDPKQLNKHTDYGRIRKWIIPDIQEKKPTEKKNTENAEWQIVNKNKDFFFECKRDNPEMESIQEMYCSGNWLIIPNTGKELSLKMNPEAFQKAFMDLLGVVPSEV